MGFQEAAKKIGNQARTGILAEERKAKESYRELTQPRGKITLRR